MREAIARAELGDDVYGEDPTVNRLERTAAALMGKEAGLLVSSGTMGNLIALLTHCGRGTKAIVGNQSHTYCYEAGGASALGGIMLAPITNRDNGELDLDELKAEVFTANDAHFAMPSLVVLENTHNRCGGSPVKLSHLAEVRETRESALAPDASRWCAHFQRCDRAGNFAERDRIVSRHVSRFVCRRASRARSGRCCAAARISLRARIGSASCSAAGCARPASSRRRVWSRSIRWSIASPRIIRMRARLAQGLTLVAGINVRPVAQRTNMVHFDIDGDDSSASRFGKAMKERGVLISARESTSFQRSHALRHQPRGYRSNRLSRFGSRRGSFRRLIKNGFTTIFVWIARSPRAR